MKKPILDFFKKKFFMPEFEHFDPATKKKTKYTLYNRCVFIGCTNRPYDCNPKDVKAVYEKKFYFPYPNYATRKLLFRHFIKEKGVEIPENF
jgi:hypothetical protein